MPRPPDSSAFIQHMALIFSRVTPPSVHHSSFLAEAWALAAAPRGGFGAVAARPAGIGLADGSGAAETSGLASPDAPAERQPANGTHSKRQQRTVVGRIGGLS